MVINLSFTTYHSHKRPSIAMYSFWDYLHSLWYKMLRDDILFLASGIAFNLLICLIPLILIIFAMAGYTFSSSSELWDNAVLYLQSLIPVSSERIINNTQRLINDRQWIGILGLGGMAFTATRLFASLRTVLDRVFEARHTRGIIHGKLFDFMILVLIATLLAAANFSLALLPNLLRENILFNNQLFSITPLLKSKTLVIIFAFLLNSAFFFLTYRFFPSRSVRTDTCLIATSIAVTVFEASKYLYGYFILMYGEFNRIYGTLAAIVALIVWFYISSLVYVLAAEIGFIHEQGRMRSLKR